MSCCCSSSRTAGGAWPALSPPRRALTFPGGTGLAPPRPCPGAPLPLSRRFFAPHLASPPGGGGAGGVTAFGGWGGAGWLGGGLAVPATLAERNMIVFVTSGVIVLTLLFGLLLPAVVRWAHLPDDEGPRQELVLAQTAATQE